MIKREELSCPTSCLNKAADDEPVFVIRAHDKCAIATIMMWISLRIECGKSTPDSQEIKEAYEWCNLVAQWRDKR